MGRRSPCRPGGARTLTSEEAVHRPGLAGDHHPYPSGPTPPNERQERTVPTNADIVRTVTEALGRGDLLAVMGLVSRDVRWAVNAADREAAPWFRVYQGKRSLPDFFA